MLIQVKLFPSCDLCNQINIKKYPSLHKLLLFKKKYVKVVLITNYKRISRTSKNMEVRAVTKGFACYGTDTVLSPKRLLFFQFIQNCSLRISSNYSCSLKKCLLTPANSFGPHCFTDLHPAHSIATLKLPFDLGNISVSSLMIVSTVSHSLHPSLLQRIAFHINTSPSQEEGRCGERPSHAQCHFYPHQHRVREF